MNLKGKCVCAPGYGVIGGLCNRCAPGWVSRGGSLTVKCIKCKGAKPNANSEQTACTI